MDEIFVSFPLSRIIPDEELPGSLYIFVSGHFVKYKSEGDELPTEKYNQFVLKKITHVFTTQPELEAFIKWSEGFTEKESKEMIEAVGAENKELVENRKETKELLQDMFSDLEFSDEKTQAIVENSRMLIGKVMEDQVASGALTRMINYNQALADHSLNVAFLSVYLAQQLGYTHQIILENVYLGGLLHDFGKTKIDPKILEGDDIRKYKKAMRAHPDLGKTLLMAKTSMPDEVLDIVAQHHERFDGKGYPKGLKGGRIYDLAKIVAIANYYMDEFAEIDGDAAYRHKFVVKKIEEESGKRFDPKKTEGAVKALRLLQK